MHKDIIPGTMLVGFSKSWLALSVDNRDKVVVIVWLTVGTTYHTKRLIIEKVNGSYSFVNKGFKIFVAHDDSELSPTKW
jgi:hypothetical protein